MAESQGQLFQSQGYLVLKDFASAQQCRTLIERMTELVDSFDPSTISIFSAVNQKQYTDTYFYDSASNISFFFEERAFDGNGGLRQPKALSINKVGHALHDLDPVFRDFSYSDSMLTLLSSLGYRQPALMQSMYIFKQPGIGGEVVAHQDNSFLYTSPPSCTGLWLALEDTNIQNGCLWVLPGSHKGGLARRFTRDEDGVRFDKDPPLYDTSDFVPLEVTAGTMIVIHGDLVHQSFENKSAKSRHAYSLHVVETDGCTWAQDNWLQRKDELPPRLVTLSNA